MYKKRYFHGQADPKGRVSQQSFTEAHTFITTQIIQQHLFHLFEDSINFMLKKPCLKFPKSAS